jgi:predicted MPP superfamily phosphohydrolase
VSIGAAVARIVLAATGAHLGLRLLPATRGDVGPLESSARIELGRGGTTVDLGPLGRATLRTHRGPLTLWVRATGIDPEQAQQLVGGATRPDLAPDARRLAFAVGARSAVAAVTGAGLLAAATVRRPRDVALTAATATGGLAAAAALAAATLDREAWRDPELSGLLTRAPLILGDLRSAPDRIARYRDQLADLLRTGTAVYRAVAELPEPPPADAIRLIHISDIHLSPLALPLTKALVEEYGADAVLDTGDLVDWGTPAEQVLAGQIATLGVPYVYVKGNHDSPGIVAAVARQPNAVVLEAGTGTREIAGLTLVGMADPRFTPDKTTGDDQARYKVGAAAHAFADTVRTGGARPDIALVHSPAAARALEGLVPLVLAGDIHRRDVRRHGDTTVLVQGSTGGAGLRGVQQDPPVPLMLSVLYVDRATRRLWGVDEVTVGGLGRTELTVTRRSVDQLVGTP